VTLALALVLLGALMIYAGIKGRSITRLLMGDASTPSKKPEPVQR
jgi:hypothetical protein